MSVPAGMEVGNSPTSDPDSPGEQSPDDDTSTVVLATIVIGDSDGEPAINADIDAGFDLSIAE